MRTQPVAVLLFDDGGEMLSMMTTTMMVTVNDDDGDEYDDRFPLSTPCNMLSRDCRGQSLYGRACQTLTHVCSRQQRFENAVHAAS